MDKNRKIGFTGPFADVNFGDYAMLVNNIYDLDIQDVTLFSYNSQFLTLIKEDYLLNYNIDIIEVKVNDYFNISLDSKERIFTPIDILNLLVNYDEILIALREIDILVVNGGGYFNSLWSMPHRIEKLCKIIAPILIANQLNKKIVFTGNSYGPFMQDAEFFGCTFNTLKNVIFGSRDNLYSPMWANTIGIDKNRLEFIPDDLLIVNNKLYNKKTRFNLCTTKYIVMETYLPIEFLKENIAVFKEFSRSIYQKHSLSILFLPFNLKHGGIEQAIYLNPMIDNFEYYDITTIGYLPIEDTINLIKNAELVVSSRYHALVVALSVGTPIVSVLKDVLGDKRYYYNKNYGILRHVLDGIEFDERYYMRLEYIETLKFISENFEQIIKIQRNNYNDLYRNNIEKLRLARESFLDRNIRCFYI